MNGSLVFVTVTMIVKSRWSRKATMAMKTAAFSESAA